MTTNRPPQVAAPSVRQLDLQRDPRHPERWIFGVQITAPGAFLVIHHLLASPDDTPYGWQVRMPEDRAGAPIVRIPNSWSRAIRAAIAAEIEKRQTL